MSDRAPSFQFYPKDWRDVKVRRMSLAAQGAYLSLLCDMWIDSKDQCSVLDCNPFLATALGLKLAAFLKIKKEIQHETEPLFFEKDGRLYSLRLKREAKKQRNYSQLQRESGRRGGLAKAKARCSEPTSEPLATTLAKPSSSSSSSSSSSDGIKKKREGGNGRTHQPKQPISSEWGPNDNHRKLALARGLDLSIEAAHFKGKSEENEWVTKDWDRKFTNWMLQEIKFRQQRRTT